MAPGRDSPAGPDKLAPQTAVGPARPPDAHPRTGSTAPRPSPAGPAPDAAGRRRSTRSPADRPPSPDSGPGGARRARPARRARRRAPRTAPALSSGALPLPHLGDCTQDGQPVRHSQSRIAARVAASQRPSTACPRSAKPGAAGMAVVHEHGGPPGVRVQRRRHAADVPAVADREQRQQADRGVLGGVQRARHARRRQPGGGERRPRRRRTRRRGCAGSARAGRAAPSPAPCRPGRGAGRPPPARSPSPRRTTPAPAPWSRRGEHPRHLDVGGATGRRCASPGRPACTTRDPGVEVELLHQVALAAVQVHRAGVHGGRGGGRRRRCRASARSPPPPRPPGRARAPDVHRAGGALPGRGPVPAGRPAAQHAVGHQLVEHRRPRARRRTRRATSPLGQRQLGGGADQLRAPARTGWPGRARSPPPGRRAAPPGGARGRCPSGRPGPRARPAPRRAPARPGRTAARTTPGCPGSRPPPPRRARRCPRRARARWWWPRRAARRWTSAGLQRAPLLGQVAAAVGGHPRRPGSGSTSASSRCAAQRGHLRTAPGADERERPRPLEHQVGEHPGGLGAGRPAHRGAVLAGELGQQRRLPQRDRAPGARRAVLGHRRHVASGQPAGERGRLGHRGRGQHERGPRAVARADPQQPAQQQRHVRAEHPAVGVALVDHHELQPAQERRPPAVPGQQRRGAACPGC